MTSTYRHQPLLRRHLPRAAAAIAGLLVGAVACSSGAGDDATAGAARTPPPTMAAPPTTSATSATSATTAPEQREAQLAQLLESHRAAGEFVGARIALQEADGTVTEATSGTTTVDPGSGPVGLDVPWNVGSVTKTFVAVIVLQLAEEGALDLDAGIDPWFPELGDAARITPRQLLQHTSGLGEYDDQPATRVDRQRAWSPTELIAVAEAGGRVGQPGGPHHYTNTNYVVLGELVERVTGRHWADELRARIVEPLGLTGTGEIDPDAPPTGYQIVDGAFVDTTRATHPSLGGAAGGATSTGRDLLRFARALADGTLLSPESQAAMADFVPAEDLTAYGIDHTYGLGLERYELDGLTVVGHMGKGEAQSAYVGWDAERGTAVAVLTNTAVAGPSAVIAVEALAAVAGARAG